MTVASVPSSNGGTKLVLGHLAHFRVDEADAGERRGDGKTPRRENPQNRAVVV